MDRGKSHTLVHDHLALLHVAIPVPGPNVSTTVLGPMARLITLSNLHLVIYFTRLGIQLSISSYIHDGSREFALSVTCVISPLAAD